MLASSRTTRTCGRSSSSIPTLRSSAKLTRLDPCRSSALWVDIHSGWYDFEQRWRDAELVKQLTKADIVSFFHTYFFATPSNPIRRLSIHLDCQRLTPEQCASLGPALVQADVPVDAAQLQQFAATRPTVDQAKVFAEQYLRSNGKGDAEVAQLLDEIERLRTLPVPEGYTLIEDREKWRAGLEKAPHAHPVAEVRFRASLL